MHALISRGTGTGWISGPRNDDFTIDVEAAAQAIAEHRPDVVFITSPNNPTGTAVEAETVLALYEAAQARPKPSHGRRRRGVRRVQPPRLAAAAARGPAESGRLPDHVQGVRRRRAAPRLSRRRPGRGRRRPAGAAAVPPVGRHPGHRAGRPGAHRHAARSTSSSSRPSGTGWSTELRAIGCEVTESDANFVQFGRFEDAHAAWQAILDRGVLVRDNGVPGWLRVTAGTPAENDAFLDAVRAVLKKEQSA